MWKAVMRKTVMQKNGLLIVALASLASALAGGCSIEDTPHAPTFSTDIKPIMLSRCVHRTLRHNFVISGDEVSTEPVSVSAELTWRPTTSVHTALAKPRRQRTVKSPN